jgi:hypothetical protein
LIQLLNTEALSHNSNFTKGKNTKMITDNLLRLSGSLTAGSTTGQDLAQIAGTYNSDNIVDLSQTRDIGEGEKLFVVFTVGTAFTSGGAATLSFNVVTSAAAGLTTPTTLGSTNLIALGSLTAGAQFVIAINPLVASLGLRYLALFTRLEPQPQPLEQ